MSEPRLQSLLIAAAGVLKLGPDRHMVMQPSTLAEIQKGVEDRLGIKASEYIYTAGVVWATSECKRLRAAAGDPDQAELARLFCQHATALGWGAWDLQTVRTEEKGLLIKIKRSPFAEAYGQSDEPVCHLAAGAVAGLTETLFHLPATCTELSCHAQGAESCQFSATGNDVAGKDAWEW
jgi:predicted hydrocarbon binding protein